MHVIASSHGGGATHVAALAAGLRERGVTSTVLMPRDGGRVDASDAWRPGTLSLYARLASFSVVHAHGLRAAFFARAALALPGAPRIPLIVSPHGIATEHHRGARRAAQRRAERFIASGAAALIGVSRAEAEELSARHPSARVEHVPMGVDLAPFLAVDDAARTSARQALRIADDAIVAIAVARLDRPRDFPTILAGLARARESAPLTLLVVGDGPDRVSIEARVRALGLDDAVRMLGLRDDVPACIAAADVLVSASWGWEALGLAPIEAQAAGLPVVVTDVGGARESFLPDETGLLIPKQNPERLAAALVRLARDASLRTRYGANGRAFATSAFALAPMIDATHALYRDVLHG